MRILKILFSVLLTAGLLGCSSAYYGVMEKLDYHKREIFIDRIKAVQKSQDAASEEFADALTQFKSVVNFDGGDLEDLYDDLNNHYQRSEIKSRQVSKRIESVRDVSEAMFAEWEDEIAEINRPEYREQSRRQLRESKVHYSRLMRKMEAAEARIPPVLTALNDQVLFLKHNLNARAISSLHGELDAIETDVQALIDSMNESIQEAQSYIDTLQPQPS